MLRKGVFAASLSIINDDLTLNIESTIKHAENLIKGGLHGVFFFGSTGQSQLISISEKKNLISKISEYSEWNLIVKVKFGQGVKAYSQSMTPLF